MSDPPPLPPSPAFTRPLGQVGRTVLSALAYVGGLGLLLASASRAAVGRRAAGPGLRRLLCDELSWMLGMGLPLVALVHVGLGSFLAMQSYYGGTFVEGTGAVVGVGLFRNIAALMSGLTLAGLVAARVTADLRARSLGSGVELWPERRVAGLVLAAGVAGPVLAIWGAGVGTLVGWQVAEGLMGVSTHSFFMMFWEMLWAVDVVGLATKGLAYGLVTGLLACHEGLRGTPDDGLAEVSYAACRAACFSAVAILAINSGWFLVVYHAGPAFGPTLLTPPAS
jgi:phospholipid/cholesterol/gamma-HCH transport system permease protein